MLNAQLIHGWWSSVGCDLFRDETYRDVKSRKNNVRGHAVRKRNVRGCNVRDVMHWLHVTRKTQLATRST
jgi:hypothetical protein